MTKRNNEYPHVVIRETFGHQDTATNPRITVCMIRLYPIRLFPEYIICLSVKNVLSFLTRKLFLVQHSTIAFSYLRFGGYLQTLKLEFELTNCKKDKTNSSWLKELCVHVSLPLSTGADSIIMKHRLW